MAKLTEAARRAAKTAWRERKDDWAVVAVRIGGQVWVSLTPNPGALENRIGFMLRQGSAPAEAMKAAYRVAGTVAFEALERLDEDLSPMARERVGKEKLAHWAEKLRAGVF